MKGHAGSAVAPPGKRRWRGPPLLVSGLVVFSLLLPLAFLLGLLNRFPYGFLVDEQPSLESGFGSYGRYVDGSLGVLEGDESKKSNVVRKFGPSMSKDDNENMVSEGSEDFDGKIDSPSHNSGEQQWPQQKDNNSHAGLKDTQSQTDLQGGNSYNQQKDMSAQSKGQPITQVAVSKSFPSQNSTYAGETTQGNISENSTGDENGKSCQLEFGSYCLWSLEHKEIMKDSIVKRLKDQLFVARAYYPTIAKLPGQDSLSHELKQNIQDHERMLSEAIVDADLPPLVERKIQKMDQVTAKAKSCAVDCHNVDKKLRQILDLTEDEAHFHMKQSAFMYHLGVQTMPKSHHCLSMRLTVEYFKSPSPDIEQSKAHKIGNPWLRHYVIFSRNILAVSVAINSTVTNSAETGSMVFHLLTDVQNYYAMKFWFARNSYNEATVHVLNFDKLLDQSYDFGAPLSLSEEYRVAIHNNDQPPPSQMRTEYLSVFGSSHFLLPQIFKHLKKVIVLDDDVVVQRDLSSLWNLDLEGKVVAAVEFCGVRLNQLKSYLGSNGYIGDSCAWMSGLNVVDLDLWREHNVSETYQSLLLELQSRDESSRRAAALPISLISFQDLIYPLDQSWVVPGLGHKYGVSASVTENSAVLHYNGNMKPWLELGIPNYKSFWRKYLTKEEPYMDECNVSV